MTIDALERGMGGHSTQSSFDEDKRSAKKEREGRCFEGQECFLSCQLVHPAVQLTIRDSSP